jgi:hypothetical protein
MPVRVVLDHPRRYLARRLWKRAALLAGVLLFVTGLAASVVAVPAGLLTLAWLADEDVTVPLQDGRTLAADQILLAFAIAAPLAVVGVRRGLRMMRRGRTLVLFLRRFGYDDAQSAATFAVTRTIGGTWRLVTLDDAEIAALGVPTGTRWLFRTVRLTVAALVGLVNVLLRALPAGVGALWVVPGADLIRARIWERWENPQAWIAVLDPYGDILTTALDGRLPVDAVALTLPGLFAALTTLVASAVLGLVTALTTAPIAWAVGGVALFLFSFPADAVREAEQAKTREIRSSGGVNAAARDVVALSRRVFGPRLVVLRVASAAWRQTVRHFAALSSLVLVDVTEPTEHLIWEIEELTVQRSTPCVFIARHDRALEIAGITGRPVGPLDAKVARLLELDEILAYTTDRPGMRRFARALHGALLARSARARTLG